MDENYFFPMRPLLYQCIVLLCITAGSIFAETTIQESPESENLLKKLDPYWSFIWAGSWEQERNLVNRQDLRVHIPWQHLTLRVQLIDKRPGAFMTQSWEEFKAGNTALSGGLYHEKTGSRILYGILDEWGLSARLRNVWAKSVPFVEHHKPSGSDLKTEPSSTKAPETYLYVGSPWLGKVKGFASILLDEALNPAVTSGLDIRFIKKNNLRIEGFYTGKELAPRTAVSWFSKSPPLPERDFHFYALGLVYTSPFLSIAADWAYSDTFAYGSDIYGNVGLRIGERPWNVSLALDGAGSRYVGSNGTALGAGFRLGVRFEHRGKKSRLFQLSTSLRSSGLAEPFEQSFSHIYYHFPTNIWNFPVKPSRVSVTVERNASNKEKIEDKIEGLVGINWGPVRSVFSGAVTGHSIAEENPLPFPFPEDSLSFHSAKIAGEVFYNLKIVHFSAKLGYTIKNEKEPVWDTSFQASVQGKPGRFSLKIASAELPALWTTTITWRLEKK